MISSDFRTEARRKLQGKWGKAILMLLAYMLVFFIVELIQGLFPDNMEGIVSLIVTIIELPLGFGLIASLFKLYNDETVGSFDFFEYGFNNFGRAWGISFKILFKMILPIIVVILSYIIIAFGIFSVNASALYSPNSSSFDFYSSYGFISILGTILLFGAYVWLITKSYYYQLSYLIAIENPNMTTKEAVLKSEELMAGNRSNLFCLQLSFIGWAILAIFTLGIGYLWLLPYTQFAIIAFYKFVNNDNSNIEATVVSDGSENNSKDTSNDNSNNDNNPAQ